MEAFERICTVDNDHPVINDYIKFGGNVHKRFITLFGHIVTIRRCFKREVL